MYRLALDGQINLQVDTFAKRLFQYSILPVSVCDSIWPGLYCKRRILPGETTQADRVVLGTKYN